MSDHSDINGWINCYVPGREDPKTSKSASGSFNYRYGVVQDRVTGETMSLFDVAVALGAFTNWREAMHWCGDRYLS